MRFSTQERGGVTNCNFTPPPLRNNARWVDMYLRHYCMNEFQEVSFPLMIMIVDEVIGKLLWRPSHALLCSGKVSIQSKHDNAFPTRCIPRKLWPSKKSYCVCLSLQTPAWSVSFDKTIRVLNFTTVFSETIVLIFFSMCNFCRPGLHNLRASISVAYGCTQAA